MNFDFIEDIFSRHVDPRLNDLYRAISSLGEPMEDLIERLSAEVAEELYAYTRGSGNTGSTTAATITLGPTPTGTAWLITNLAWISGASGVIDIYIDAVDPPNLIYTNSNGIRGSQVGVDLYVPAGRQVVIQFTGLANNTACFVTAVVKQLVLQPDEFVSGGKP